MPSYCKCGKLKDKRSKVCKKCDKHSGFLGKHHSDITKEKISIKSKAKFTDAYWRKFRKIMEGLGHWIPLKDKTNCEIYYYEANWIRRMFDYSSKDELDLLKKQGLFNQFKNTKGVVRDHKYSRKSGFINKVFPEILRHPCNCAIILHSDNIKKKRVKYEDKDSITLDELFSQILHFDKQWVEQDICLNLIRRYKNGERWERR